MDWLQLIVLSLIQGITEFLPISSSAHLILPAQLSDWPDQGLAFDVAVHFGTLVAVVVYFKTELVDMLQATLSAPSQVRRYGFRSTLSATAGDPQLRQVSQLAFATLPIVIIGFVAKDFIDSELRSITVIATTTLLFGLVLWYADTRPQQHKTMSFSVAGWIGLAQCIALIPGTSRSGITMTAALLIGLGRTQSARFSFLLAIPTILGAQMLMLLDISLKEMLAEAVTMLSAAALAGISAYACIHVFIRLVERTGMRPYVYYRIALGLTLFSIIAWTN
ncbi:MAG: undecaprenyl-diphosphate phosphatase [Pseudomonadota bacterium]|nr:undecaprenyl-diphosphate phosphatase [Pseudomonadota bacterium]